MKALKNFIVVFSFLLFLYQEGISQNFIYDLKDFSTLPDTSINIFIQSSNPALLNFDVEDERLFINSSFNSKSEKVKRFFNPTKTDLYQIEFSGKKSIGEYQIFKGKFGFNRLIRKDWNWIFSKDFQSGNPFLLGDSSSGNSFFNGIYFNAMYYNELSEKFTAGAALDYFVDEGLKKVTPKPTSQHRNIIFKAGLSYQMLEFLKFGLMGKFEDRKEEISYREDEGAIYREITLLKFRGFDYPIAVQKKTETRISYSNNYALIGDVVFNPAKSILFYGNMIKGIEQILQKEEITNPQSRGYFQNDYLKAIISSNIRLSNRINSIIGVRYFSSSSWSKHPEFKIVLSDNEQRFYNFYSNIACNLESNTSFFGGLGLGEFNFQINDYYSNVFFDVRSIIYSFTFGMNLSLSKNLLLKSLISLENYEPQSSNLSFSGTGVYFNDYLRNDLDYFSTSFINKGLAIMFLYNSIIGEFVVDINYQITNSKNFSKWENQKNSDLKMKIGYRVKAY